MKYEERKAIVKEAYKDGKIAQDVMGQIMLNNLSDEIIEREHEDGSLSNEIYNKLMNNEKEDTTMKTTNIKIDLTEGVAKFELNGTTYKYNIDSKQYAKTTPDGKTVRIGKAEYESAEHEAEQFIANLDLHETAEVAQAELDKEPCQIESDLTKPAVLNENGCVDCRECNVKHCVHRDCMRRNPRSEGGLGECPRLNIKAEEDEAKDPEIEQIEAEIPGIEDAEAELERNIRHEKKTRKPRRSKDIAYEGHGITLTAKQVDFIHHLPDTCFWEMGIHSVIWVDVLCDDIGGQFADKPMTVGAMISTICEKGLGFRTRDTSREGKPIAFSLTDLGKEVAEELGLN